MDELDGSSQAKYSNADPQSLAEEGMVLQLVDGTIQACNAVAEKLLGLTTEQIRCWTSTHFPWQTIHEDGTDFPCETHPAITALRTGQPQFNIMMGLYHPDRDLIWLTIDAQPLFQVSDSTTYGVISKFVQISPSQYRQNHRQNPSQEKLCSDLAQLPDSNLSYSLRQEEERSLRERQAQLQQQLAEIEAIYQSAPIGLTVLDTDLRFVRINQRLAEINGFPIEAHIGRTVRELLPGLADTAERMLCPVLESGEPLLNVEIEGETPAQPGVKRTWLEHFLPLKHGDKVIGISTVCEEITERKQAQAQIQDQQERLHAALFAAETGTFRWDIRTNVLNWDDNLDRLFGLPPGQTARSLDAFIQMVHPNERQGVINRCHRCATEGADFEMDFRVVYPDGSIRWLLDKGKTFFDEKGSPLYMTGACVDITDRKQALEALRQSEERYRILFESMEDGFCVVEVLFDKNNTPIDYRFLEMNPAFETQSGLKQAKGKTVRQLLPNLENHWFEIYGKVALTGEPVRFEDGSEVMNRFFEVSAFRIGQPLSRKVAILFKEISDRKAIEAQREKLFQQELVAREAAERANRIKDEFLAVLSHELRSPLNPILGWTKLLQSGKLNTAKTAEALAIIERNGKLQSKLIEDLLDVSSILRGKLTLNEAPVDIATTITAALETVRLAAEAKNIQINVSLGEVSPINGDAGRLQQVICNLLTNAIKFTPEFGRVEVRLTQVQSYAQIQVCDTGKGISREFLPYVFEHFRQEDGAITRKFGGLGLGLAIVRQIVEMHGGTVRADSLGEGQGATFTVTFPLPTQTLATSEQDYSCVSMAQPATLAGTRVLVVDDDDDSREFVTFVLELAGAEVIPTSSAIKGMQILAQSQFDILVSDIGMPEIDGYAFLQQIRARLVFSGRQIPAIALTAYAGELDQKQALAAGFQQHLSKPVDPEQLVEAVVTLVKKL
jgi:PAS domain S-box-containing protein